MDTRHRVEWALKRWEDAEAAGVMRESTGEISRRVVDGTLRLAAQFNPMHVENKRPAAADLKATEKAVEILTGTKDHSAVNSFNFTKVNPKEFLCGFSVEGDNEAGLHGLPKNRSDMELPRNGILVNVSPLMRGHFLCVPDLPLVKPQKLEEGAIRSAMSIARAFGRRDFALGFNSAGAWSSVNHLHFQGFFLAETTELDIFPVLTHPRELLVTSGSLQVQTIPNWPVDCVVLESSLNSQDVTTLVWSFVNMLQRKGVPYNLLIAFEANGPTAIVFPRQIQQQTESNGKFFGFAVVELAGLVIADSQQSFDQVSEEMFIKTCQEQVALPKDRFKSLVEEWKGVVTAEQNTTQ